MRNNFDMMGWLFKLVPAFIVFCFVAVIVSWIFLAVTGVKVLNTVNDKGLKSVVERVWEGSGK